MSVFTCITCRVAFVDAELQRAHYKTDWHRYNLKRKVAELPPVSAENFNTRVLAQKSQVEDAEKDTTAYCVICKKKFNSENSYKTHLKSKKHQEAEKNYDPESEENKNRQNKATSSASGSHKADNSSKPTEGAISHDVMSEDEGEESDVESWNSDDAELMPIEECLFCPVISDNLEDNVKHMTQEHSFFIPDAEYLVDLEGLISYLGEKVSVGNMCLWCNTRGRSFYSKQAAKNHMVDKGHSKMLHEGEAVFEYSDFYDYRKSYPDHGIRLRADNEEEEMEVDNEMPDLVGDGFELVLPSGATIGHRSLARYYKQRLRHDSNKPQHRAIMPSILTQYRALGWTGATGPMVEQKKKDIMYMQKLRNKHYVQLGVKGNKLYRNFKPQNPI